MNINWFLRLVLDLVLRLVLDLVLRLVLELVPDCLRLVLKTGL